MSLKKTLDLLNSYLLGKTNERQEAILDKWYYSIDDKRPVPQLQDPETRAALKDSIKLPLMARLQGSEAKVIGLRKYARVIAAAIIAGLLCTAGIKYYYATENSLAASPEVWKAIHVEDGKLVQVQLPDGSVIVANGGSRLKVLESFGGGERRIRLEEGEAYFEVARDTLHPFIVHTPHIRVQVLGTSFSVRDYHDENDAGVRVSTGKVAVTTGTDSLQLTRGESVTYDKKFTSIARGVIKPEMVNAWTRNELVFDNASLENVLQVLKHRYGYAFEVRQQKLMDKRFRATFRDQSLMQILDQLALIGSLKYSVDKNTIHIW